jgi:hypothetical protein
MQRGRMVRLLRQHLPVKRLGFLAAPRLVQLQRFLHIGIERAGRSGSGARVRRSSLVSVNGKPAVFVRPPD